MSGIKTWLASLRVRSAQFALLATIAATGIAFVTTSGMAHATDYCYNGTLCINAWGGGPDVKAYSFGVANDNFLLQPNGSYWNVIFAGSGAYHNYCISDYGNDAGNARAELISCAGGGGSTPWGANFDLLNCNSGGYAGYDFDNVHWGGNLGPQSISNGSPMYLNKPSAWCFQID